MNEVDDLGSEIDFGMVAGGGAVRGEGDSRYDLRSNICANVNSCSNWLIVVVWMFPRTFHESGAGGEDW